MARHARHGVSQTLQSRYWKADPRILSYTSHRHCRNRHACRLRGVLPWSVLRMKILRRRLLHSPARGLDRATSLLPQLELPAEEGGRSTYFDVHYLMSCPSCRRLRSTSKEEQNGFAMQSTGVQLLRSLLAVSRARLNHVARESKYCPNDKPVRPGRPISYPRLACGPYQDIGVASAHDEACFARRISSWSGVKLDFGASLQLS